MPRIRSVAPRHQHWVKLRENGLHVGGRAHHQRRDGNVEAGGLERELLGELAQIRVWAAGRPPVAPASRPRPATHHRSCGNQPAHIRLTNEVDQPGRPRPPRERQRRHPRPPTTGPTTPDALDRPRSISRVGSQNGDLVHHTQSVHRHVVAHRCPGVYFRERAAAFARWLCATPHAKAVGAQEHA